MDKKAQIRERIDRLRQLMKQYNMQAYLVTTGDFHGSEYVGDYFKTRAFMTGFTGSAGTLVVLEEEAALWTDGRYFLQAQEQLEGTGIILMRMGEEGVPALSDYLAGCLQSGDSIGFDGRTVSARLIQQLVEKNKDKKISFAYERDLIDQIWTDRPALSKQPVWELDVSYAGIEREEKLQKIRQTMEQKQADYLLLTALDEVAWVLNLRGGDVLYTPVFLSFLLFTPTQTILYVQEEIIDVRLREKLVASGVTIQAYDAVYERVTQIEPGHTILLQEEGTNFSMMQCIAQGVRVLDEDVISLRKAVKNPVEMQHIRCAHQKDSAAVIRLLYWLQNRIKSVREQDMAPVTERDVVEQLEVFRRQQAGYLQPSFASIVAYGAHGAIVHYEPSEESNTVVQPQGLCLADVGGHYLDGTTDLTRTIVLGPLTEEEKIAYTTVLRGHLRLGAAVFKEGVCGANLDYLAREPLWEQGLDYLHGTGHGVGYLLSVHEGPQRLHWKVIKGVQPVILEEGMLLSNEPGLYVEGKFGIRHENLMLVRKGMKTSFGQYLYLEPLTMVPFDREAILPQRMTQEELTLLNDYHKKVYQTMAPFLEPQVREWLAERTAPLDGTDNVTVCT